MEVAKIDCYPTYHPHPNPNHMSHLSTKICDTTPVILDYLSCKLFYSRRGWEMSYKSVNNDSYPCHAASKKCICLVYFVVVIKCVSS